jgi:hypothetical protein
LFSLRTRSQCGSNIQYNRRSISSMFSHPDFIKDKLKSCLIKVARCSGSPLSGKNRSLALKAYKTFPSQSFRDKQTHPFLAPFSFAPLLILTMQFFYLLGAFLTLHFASASPRPQNLNFDDLVSANGVITPSAAPLAVTATATTVSFNAASASSAAASVIVTDVTSDGSSSSKKRSVLIKRDGDCSVQRTISSYSLPPNSTATQFMNNQTLHALSISAPNTATNGVHYYNIATLPQGASGSSQVFKNLNGAANAAGYLGYYTYSNYDVQGCLQACEQQASNAANGNQCVAFNIYIERDPSLSPNAVACPNPAPILNFKCSLYSLPLSPSSATNTGQFQDSFQVAIIGSNGYNKVTSAQAIVVSNTYAQPTNLKGVIDAPNDSNGVDTYIGSASFFTPNVNNCAVKCDALTAMNKASAAASHQSTYQSCNFFNYFILQKDGKAVQQVCNFYTAPWDSSYATNTGYTSTIDGSVYTYEASASYQKSNVVRTDVSS